MNEQYIKTNILDFSTKSTIKSDRNEPFDVVLRHYINDEIIDVVVGKVTVAMDRSYPMLNTYTEFEKGEYGFEIFQVYSIMYDFDELYAEFDSYQDGEVRKFAFDMGAFYEKLREDNVKAKFVKEIILSEIDVEDSINNRKYIAS